MSRDSSKNMHPASGSVSVEITQVIGRDLPQASCQGAVMDLCQTQTGWKAEKLFSSNFPNAGVHQYAKCSAGFRYIYFTGGEEKSRPQDEDHAAALHCGLYPAWHEQ